MPDNRDGSFLTNMTTHIRTIMEVSSGELECPVLQYCFLPPYTSILFFISVMALLDNYTSLVYTNDLVLIIKVRSCTMYIFKVVHYVKLFSCTYALKHRWLV